MLVAITHRVNAQVKGSVGDVEIEEEAAEVPENRFNPLLASVGKLIVRTIPLLWLPWL